LANTPYKVIIPLIYSKSKQITATYQTPDLGRDSSLLGRRNLAGHSMNNL